MNEAAECIATIIANLGLILPIGLCNEDISWKGGILGGVGLRWGRECGSLLLSEMAGPAGHLREEHTPQSKLTLW